MGMNWFDLKSEGAKLDRPQDANGNFFVRLSFNEPVDPEVIVRASRYGWQASDGDKAGLEFRNYGSFDRLSQLLRMVSVFVPEETVRKLKVDSERLTQGEEIKGFTAPIVRADLVPDRAEVERNLTLMASNEKRERIIARVGAAQKVMGVSAHAGNALFNNDGAMLWKRLCEQFGGKDATRAMLGVLRVGLRQGELFSGVQKSLMDAAETGHGLPMDVAVSERAVNNMLMQRTLMGDAGAEIDDERFLRQIFLSAGRVNYRVWDAARLNNYNRDGEPDLAGVKFIGDSGLPKSWKRDVQWRISDTLSGISAALGVPARDLFNGKAPIIHLGMLAGNGTGPKGYHATQTSKIGGVVTNVRAIKISPFECGALVHEIGHAVEQRARSVSESHADAMMDAMIVKTGVHSEVGQSVGRAREAGLITDEHADYLMKPTELVARSFEAALTNHAISQGDEFCARYGGVLSLSGAMYFQPSPETAQKFLMAMTEVMNEARNLRIENEHTVQNDTELSM